MNIFSLQCVEIVQNEGWAFVGLSFFSNDPTIGAGGNLTFTIGDASHLEIGKFYDLQLNEVIQG